MATELTNYNNKAVSECLELLKKGFSVCYVSGVGTGKTFVVFELFKYLDGKVLYIYPKHSVGRNISLYNEYKLFSDRITFKTYNYFSVMRNLEKYSLIVIDECHHVTSSKYGSNLIKSINGKYCIGLTATPIISSRDSRDLFDRTVYGISNFEAIKIGIMSPYNYHICCKEFEDGLIKAFTFDTVRTDIDIHSSIPLARSIIEKAGVSKWIIFFKSINQMKDYEDDIRLLFSGFEIFGVHSQNKFAMDIIKRSNSLDRVVLMTCTMLTEGIHLKGFEGVVLFRNVQSHSLFQQILGRISYIGNSKNITVIDYSECAFRLLFSIIRTNFLNSSFKDSKDKPIVYININDIRNISIDKLLEMFSNESYKIQYRGKVYSNLENICIDYGISIDDVIECKKTYNISTVKAVDMVLLSKCNSYKDDDYL